MPSPLARPARRAAALLLVLAGPALIAAHRPTPAPPPFARFVDGWLERFARHHPSIAAGNGLHQHDDLLEDFSIVAVAEEVSDLENDRSTLRSYRDRDLTAEEEVDRRILLGIVDGWLLDLRTVRTFRKNPMVYASAVTDGLQNLMTMTSAPAATRMAQATAKLRQVPRLLRAARANLKEAPRIYVERGAAMFAGAQGMVQSDLALAFPAGRDDSVRTVMLRVADSIAPQLAAYAAELRQQAATAPVDGWQMGRDAVQARYAAEELIDEPLDTLMGIARRELAIAQGQFRAAARMVDSTRPPAAVWAELTTNHPAPGMLVGAANSAVGALFTFVREKGLAGIPTDEWPQVEAAPPFALGLAAMHASPPLEAAPVPSVYSITDADPTWPAAQREAWLERFNKYSLLITTAHEVMPGHWLHAMWMRQTTGKVRRLWIGLNPFPQPSSGQDGWAHYAEQLVVDAGFNDGDPRYRMAQLSDAMTRIVRLMAGIELHRGNWTVDSAATWFATQAYVPGPAARREAERGTYDPTYGGYFLGKLAALKLRKDLQAREGASFNLRTFHERVMRNGIAPWWAHRQLLMPGDTGRVIE